jgi:hypothetical protein
MGVDMKDRKHQPTTFNSKRSGCSATSLAASSSSKTRGVFPKQCSSRRHTNQVLRLHV